MMNKLAAVCVVALGLAACTEKDAMMEDSMAGEDSMMSDDAMMSDDTMMSDGDAMMADK